MALHARRELEEVGFCKRMPSLAINLKLGLRHLYAMCSV